MRKQYTAFVKMPIVVQKALSAETHLAEGITLKLR
jgi:hypothetical protein